MKNEAFEILASWAWRKVDLLNQQRLSLTDKLPEQTERVNAAVKEYRRANRIKRELDSLQNPT